jgi:hypothetical protein
MAEYDNIFLTMPDVYRDEGTNAFTQLPNQKGGRNLIVIPASLRDELGETHAGKKVIAHLASRVKHPLKKDEAKRFAHGDLDGVTVMRFDEGLDVAYVFSNGGSFSIEETMGQITKTWNLPDDGTPILMTIDDDLHLDYAARGMAVEKPKFLIIDAGIVNDGIISGSEDLLAALYSAEGCLPIDTARELMGGDPLVMHQFLKFGMGPKAVYGRVTGDVIRRRGEIEGAKNLEVRLLGPKETSKKLSIGGHAMGELFGISPRDMEQYLALQYGLLNPDVSLLFLCGGQGSGKTLLSYVAAIDQIAQYPSEVRASRGMDEDQMRFFEQVVLLKPQNIMGGTDYEIGFLPGSAFDKLKPHIAPYIDAHKESTLRQELPFEQLVLSKRFANEFGPKRTHDQVATGVHLPTHEPVEVPNIGFARGRSIPRAYFLIDEAQNIPPYVLKTLIERAAPGSKMIIMGDPLQVDNFPKCTIERNGLTFAIKHFFAKPYSALVRLPVNYRSVMSRDASDMQVYSY